MASGEIEPLELDHLDIDISHHSQCTGAWDHDTYKPCPESRKLGQGSICQECASEFLPELACNFEPICDGELCANAFCHQEHSVYLAYHGELAKVGMTTSRRLRQRAIEQGCDAYAEIVRTDGRASARALEIRLSENLGLRQMIREIESLYCMTDIISHDRIQNHYMKLKENVAGLGLNPGRLEFLEGYPLETPLHEMPRPRDLNGRHSGDLIGLKGKFLIYKKGGLNALNIQKIVGRIITC